MNETKNHDRDELVKNPCGDDPDCEQSICSENEETDPQIEETGSVLTLHRDSVIHCLTIIGQIEGHYV